jgi:MFS family permease
MYLPYHLAAIGEGRPEQLAPVMMASTAVGSVGSAGYGWVRRYFSAVPIYIGALVLAAAGLLVIAATQGRTALFAGIVIYAAGLGTLMPHLFSSCAAATPAIYRARMMGFVRATFYGGPLLAQVGLELVLGRFGPSAAVAAISLICLAGALLALAFRKSFLPVE